MAARFQAKLVSCDMPEDRFELITRIVEAKFSDLGDTPALVLSILEAIEARISKGYHCIIGTGFGACVDHQKGHYITMQLGNWDILIFKS